MKKSRNYQIIPGKSFCMTVAGTSDWVRDNNYEEVFIPFVSYDEFGTVGGVEVSYWLIASRPFFTIALLSLNTEKYSLMSQRSRAMSALSCTLR